jgi:hypothetical protein
MTSLELLSLIAAGCTAGSIVSFRGHLKAIREQLWRFIPICLVGAACHHGDRAGDLRRDVLAAVSMTKCSITAIGRLMRFLLASILFCCGLASCSLITVPLGAAGTVAGATVKATGGVAKAGVQAMGNHPQQPYYPPQGYPQQQQPYPPQYYPPQQGYPQQQYAPQYPQQPQAYPYPPQQPQGQWYQGRWYPYPPQPVR